MLVSLGLDGTVISMYHDDQNISHALESMQGYPPQRRCKDFQALCRLPCRPDCCCPRTSEELPIHVTRAAGLAEAHAKVIIGVLKRVDDAEYSGYIKCKLVEW